GFTVEVDSREVTLNTRTAQIEELESSFIEDLLTVLANPNIVFLLIAIGVQAILIEISSPGGWIAGFIGVVCLSLAVYGLGILPVNWFGMIFLALAFVLFFLDIKAPTHGALTAAGVASLIVGGLVLFNAAPAVPGFQPISVPLVVGASVVMGGIFFVIMLFAIRAQKAPARMGQESLTGRIGIVHTELNPRGLVQLEGEQWSAELMPGEAPILRGERVRVMMVDGLKLIVRHVQDV
ncbi:MAG TPA: NfeD family protein, partial [Anaerolineales bacterium]|nr:NfeD family protein [Anaerolineales bacterium]